LELKFSEDVIGLAVFAKQVTSIAPFVNAPLKMFSILQKNLFKKQALEKYLSSPFLLPITAAWWTHFVC